MPARPVEYEDTVTAVVYVRVPGWLRNRIVRLATDQGVTINSWAANVLHRAAEEGLGLPEPPPPVTPLPTLDDVVRGYLTDAPLVEPCGAVSPCERTGTFGVSGVEYCRECRIRVR